jgi:hypothetical protein
VALHQILHKISLKTVKYMCKNLPHPIVNPVAFPIVLASRREATDPSLIAACVSSSGRFGNIKKATSVTPDLKAVVADSSLKT